jgi:hypothetical protein
VRILPSARKHGIPDEDIEWALDHILRYREQEYDGEVRVFIIGVDRIGRFLELIAVPHADPQRVIHADVLQPNHYYYL